MPLLESIAGSETYESCIYSGPALQLDIPYFMMDLCKITGKTRVEIRDIYFANKPYFLRLWKSRWTRYIIKHEAGINLLMKKEKKYAI